MRKILILNLIPNTVGDNLLLTPVFAILKKQYPETEIHVTVSPLNKTLFENNPNVTKIHPIKELVFLSKKKSKLLKFFVYLKMVLRLGLKFRKECFDLAFVFLPHFFLSALIPYFAGIPQRIGYRFPNHYLDFLLTKAVRYRGIEETQDYERHFVESYLDLLRAAGISFTKKDVVSRIYFTQSEEKELSKFLKKHNLVKKKYVCVHPFARYNSWPLERFQKVIDYIVTKKKLPVIVVGSPKERNRAQKLANVKNLAGKSTLRMNGLLLKHSRFNICNDSGLAHLSSSAGGTAVIPFGHHSPKHCEPKGPGKSHCVWKFWKSKTRYAPRTSKKGKEMMEAVTVDDILEVVKSL